MAIIYGDNARVVSKGKSRVINDFIIDEITLISFDGEEYDIRNMRLKINIYSDIFNPCLSGTISILDSLDLPVMYPLVGEEKLRISFSTPYEDDDPLPPIKKEFRIYKMENRGLENNQTQIYILKFISEEFIKQNKTRVFRTFKDKTYTEMIEEIYKEYIEIKGTDKQLFLEETEFDQHFCVSNKSPVEAINTIASRSTSAEFDSKAFVFYENFEGFVFKSLGNLKSQEEFIEMSFGVIDINRDAIGAPFSSPDSRPEISDLGDSRDKNQANFRTAQQYLWSKSFDVLENQSYGYYNSKLFTYDPIRQVWDDEIDFDLDEEFDNFVHLAKEKTYTEALDAKGDPLSNFRLRRTNKDHDTIPWIAEREPGILPFQLEEYIQQRTYELKSIEENKLIITTSGNPEIMAGQVMKFYLPENSGKISHEFKQELDRYFSGKWLILSTCHRLERDQYFLDLEITKDSLENVIEHDDILDKYLEIMRND